MQSPSLTRTDSIPASTSASEQPVDMVAEPEQQGPEGQAKDHPAVAPADPQPPEMSQHTQRGAQSPANVAAMPTAEAEDAAKRSTESSSGPKTNVQNVRRYVPSKKAMLDPLKMDMTKSLVEPLSSSQLSLHCVECHIIFSDHKSKDRHVKLKHPVEYEKRNLKNALFACYVCDRHFTNSTDLMAHQKAHTEKKPFKCPVCDQAFRRSSELTSHKKAHFGLFGYTCTECGKPCKTLTLLKYHQRTHTGERPYVCKECGKRFPMPKALHKHMISHSPEGAEGEEKDDAAKKRAKKDEGKKSLNRTTDTCNRKECCFYIFSCILGSPPVKLHCSMCKATFKNSKTRQRHMKIKHNVLPSGQSKPVITPISISQPTRLQLEAAGPLQKVDANIDTAQIRKLIESLGTVKKVNQVVLLGQVPGYAPPLELQAGSQPAGPLDPGLSPPQIDFEGLKPPESKTTGLDASNYPCGFMDQTIILEPITPDGENPPLSELASCVAAGEAAQTVGEVVQRPLTSEMLLDNMTCQNEENDLEQTIILELTPALTPTAELEHSQTEPQNMAPSSSLVLNTDQEAADQTAINEQDASLTEPPPVSTAQLDGTSTSLDPEHKELPSDPLDSPDKPSQVDPNEGDDACTKMTGQDQLSEGELKTQEHNEEHLSEKSGMEGKKNHSEAESSSKAAVPSDMQSKHVPQTSELALNVMSAQELVKVRKRKPARTFFFPGYIQDLAGSIYKDDFLIDAKPAKRQRTKKSHLVVKFSPQSKDKKNKKKKQELQQPRPEDLTKGKAPAKRTPEKKMSLSPKKGAKGKKDAAGGGGASGVVTKSPPTPVAQIKEDVCKNKLKKKKVGKEDAQTSGQKAAASPVFKKKKQPKVRQEVSPKSAKTERARKKTPTKKVKKPEEPNLNAVQDSLLLLKGHKQPQLKVYKLDPSRASSQPQDASVSKKKGGRAKKALSLMSSLKSSQPPPDAPPTKPKATRKRKASSKVETEGVITSKRALECKDCGEKFSDVSSLQKHKTTAHTVESPSLTYTNGNIFEGVSRLEFYPSSKVYDGGAAVKNAATGWDTEPEMGEMTVEDREQNVSFPALIPSPSLPVSPPNVDINALEGASRRDENKASPLNVCTLPRDITAGTDRTGFLESAQAKSSERRQLFPPECASKSPSSECEAQGTTEEDFKEDLLLEVDLVTVGEQNERDRSSLDEDTSTQKDLNTSDSDSDKHPEQICDGRSENEVTSQTVFCSTNQVKEEEEEMLVQRRGEDQKSVVMSRRRRRGSEPRRGDAIRKTGSVGESQTETESEQDECQVVYEIHSVFSDQESDTKSSPGFRTMKGPVSVAFIPSGPSAFDKSSEERVVLELESVTTSVQEVMNEHRLHGGGETDREADQSPGIVLERFLTSRQRSSDKEASCRTADQREGFDGVSEKEVQFVGSQEIKVEEIPPDPTLQPPACRSRQGAGLHPQHHRAIRTVLVKEESGPLLNAALDAQGSRRMQWAVEPISSGGADGPLIENGQSPNEACRSPEFNTKQCIFYPVKEEERELLLASAQTNADTLSLEGFSDGAPAEHQPAEYGASFSDSEWQPSDVRDFLLKSCDEDVSGFELSDPQRDTEAEVMAYFNRKQSSSSHEPNPTSASFSTSSHLQPQMNGTRTREPIDYFSKYFGWDTWAETSTCTNKLCKMSNPVTSVDVARFVGIHIAMGTLKFPSPRLYWEDLTKVPLIADAMPLTRFVELSRTLQLPSPAEEQPPGDGQSRDDKGRDLNCSPTQMDPLWKVQPILGRFNAECQSLRKEDNYAVDQYPLPLTCKTRESGPSLLCTALIGLGGLLLHVDLNVDPPDKEGVVEKMAPKSSMVFLCKQELSTPAMMERLLDAGVHAAGKVGGARGQIGDEFVSSDRKLMLRRSHSGFILSTAGNGRRSMASLTSSFQKAQMSARLNRDLLNLYSTPLTATPPHSWPQAVLWYLIDLALVNSWLLYREDHGTAAGALTFMAFRLDVSKALTLSSSSDTQDSIPPQPPSEETHGTSQTPSPMLVEDSPLPDAATRYDGAGHWPEQLAEGEGGRCRFGDCQRTSRVLCLKCCVFLCISRNHNCFLNFHNQDNLGRK
uniref:C2H2-type domain-containing protein n=1 Tax=Oryzias latipes TaxID=8090 RepID=A0A3P9ID54_ORYLA